MGHVKTIKRKTWMWCCSNSDWNLLQCCKSQSLKSLTEIPPTSPKCQTLKCLVLLSKLQALECFFEKSMLSVVIMVVIKFLVFIIKCHCQMHLEVLASGRLQTCFSTSNTGEAKKQWRKCQRSALKPVNQQIWSCKNIRWVMSHCVTRWSLAKSEIMGEMAPNWWCPTVPPHPQFLVPHEQWVLPPNPYICGIPSFSPNIGFLTVTHCLTVLELSLSCCQVRVGWGLKAKHSMSTLEV